MSHVGIVLRRMPRTCATQLAPPDLPLRCLVLCPCPGMANAVHHIELWTSDLAASAPSFDWLLTQLGWRAEVDAGWPQGRTWRHESGVYVVLEASSDVSGAHDRTRAGLNHLALRVSDRHQLDQLSTACGEHGWSQLFAERYPHAGGARHMALYIENAEGFEVELIAD